jgi:formylglycine-generating enzyme required for sulfatase activity
MLDACHAGSFGNFSMAMRSASSAEVNRMLTTLGQVQDGIAVLTSSSAAEQSQEGGQFCGGHGAFTCALLEGLKGKADSDRNGLVQIRELFDFTYREVKQLTKGVQHPAIDGRYDNGLPLATTLSPEEQRLLGLPKKDLKYADYEALKAKAEYQLKLERAWQAVDGIAKMQELPPDNRLSAMSQFLQDFPDDNRHRSEADRLIEQIRVETKQRELEQQKLLEASRAKSAQQTKIDQAWKSLQGVQQGNTDPKNRLLALNQFLQEYPADNRYRSEAERLMEQAQQEVMKQDLQRQKQLEASRSQAAYQSKLEQSWSVVGGSAAKSAADPESRISALNQFLQEFPSDNQHRAEAEQLVEQLQRETKQKKTTDMKQPELARAPAYEPGPEADANFPREITGTDGVRMVLIPSGEFMMGSSAASDERPAHRVFLDAYYIDAFEVTNARYAKFLEAVVTQKQPHQWNTVKLSEDGARPVIGVNWFEAESYCKWTGRRLPTEAEWEKAARGTDGRKYPWGDEDPHEGVANFGRCCGWKGFGLLSPVGAYQPGISPYGVFDMAGNVWEWVSDWYDAQYYKTSPTQNPTGPIAGREKVMRGGSWSNRAGDIRATIRDKVAPTYRNYSIGFRCATNVKR